MSVTELKAMALVGIAVLLASFVVDVILLKMDASGEAFVLSLAVFGVVASLATNRVIKHYTKLDERRERERVLRLR